MTGEYAKAKEAIPSFSYYSEKYCLQGLVSNPNDYYGAFQRIPRNTKFICGHAFQSYIWNMAASERVNKLGLGVAVGDLVFLSPDVELEDTMGDDDGVNFSEADDKVASIACVAGENINESVHVVTEDDIAANRFVSTDVVLPLLGFNSLLPSNEVGPFIQKILSDNDITLELFRKHPFFQFSGSYRRVFSRPGNFEWSTVAYSDRNSDILSTELQDFQVKDKPKRKDRTKDDTVEVEEGTESKEDVVIEVEEKKEENQETPPQYLAAVLKFSLPAGAYATMLLREVMKTSTDTGYHSGLTASSMKSSTDSINAATAAAAKVESTTDIS
jgi:tRNA pseudouridine13 synthase